MEKRGVELVEEEDQTKTAGKTKTCPDCGGVLNPKDLRYCDNCGTKPFEKRPQER